MTVKAGHSLRIQIPFRARPIPRAKWVFQSRPIEAQRERYEIETTQSYTYLLVREVTRKDAGVYSCALENNMGKKTFKVNVNVIQRPSPVEDVTFVSATTSDCTIKFAPPKDNGGQDITNYIIEKQEIRANEDEDHKPWRLVTGTTLSTTYTIDQLIEGKAYFFRVSAENTQGASDPREVTEAVIIKPPFGKPEPPTHLEVCGITKESCMLASQANKNDGGARVTNYHVYKRDNREANSNWILVSPKCPETLRETYFSIKDLVEGNRYDFCVSSENAAGVSDKSEVYGPVKPKSTVSIMAPKIQEYLHNIQSAVDTDVAFVCRVTANPKPLVKWYKSGRELQSSSKYSLREGKGNVFELRIKGANKDDEAEYMCRAVNEAGCETTKALLTVQVPAKINLQRHIIVDGYRCTQHDMIEMKVPIEGYPQPDCIWKFKNKQVFPDSRHKLYTSPTHTTLQINDTQRSDTGMYIIQCKNRFGNDQNSIDLLVATVPDAPHDIRISDVERDSVHLIWRAPEDDGGLPLLKYTIEMCPTSSDRWTKAGSTRKTEYTLINLSGQTSYKFRISVENDIGSSEPSAESDSITTKEDKYIAANYDEFVADERHWQAYNPRSQEEGLMVKYQIFEELGRGSFGVLHRALEIKTQKNWAAKFIKFDSTDKANIVRETEIMKKLQHNRLHQLYELYTMRCEFVLITEFLAGVPLLERIANAHYEFNETVAVHLVTQMLEGLEFMHSEKIIHLDLCPQNIVFTTKRSNTIKITDFGCAHVHKPNDQFRHPYQNAEYKAPEIVSNDMVTTETDMWSLGVITYMMVSGISPFKGESDEETKNFVYDSDFDYSHEVFKEVITVDCMDFISKLIVREKPMRMKAHHALTHKWLQPVYEEVDRKAYEAKLVPLNCQRHRAVYNDSKKLVKGDDSAV
jgi:titin